MLSDLVEDRYAHCNQLSKSNEKMNRYEYADEIMEKCNQLIASQDPYREKYKVLRSLMKEYDIDWPYGINGTEMDSMNFALMVRVVQLYALDYEIESFYQSHYQVELLGIEYAGEFRDKKGNRVVRLHPEYISQNPDLNPVYYVNGEKLSTDGTYWYYTPHNSDTIVSFDFDVMRWGQPFHGNCGTKMSFDPKKTTTP
ncbi:MAG: hypothetical protein II865_07500 [Bacteroidales bacterium]|nr:hypothetical protein [Bacteroidales bacterium]